MKKSPTYFRRLITGPSRCWFFDGAHDGRGYPATRHGGRVQRVVRVLLDLSPGDGREVHPVVCGRRDCVHPAHFRIGSGTDRLLDAIARGTVVPPPKMFGLKNPAARHPFDIVRQVRALRRRGVALRDLARRYGVSPATVHRWISRRHRVVA